MVNSTANGYQADNVLYEDFRADQQELTSILKMTGVLLDKLGLSEARKSIGALERKVASDTFKILVLGNFKNGKSTLINSLLGGEVLPSKVLPCTAIVCEVRYGQEKKAFLHFKRELPRNMPSRMPEDVLAHMRRHGMRNVPPMEIDVNNLNSYAIIPSGQSAQEAMQQENPYEKVVLYWPLELLKNRVEVIDSPGLNEDDRRTEETMNYLSKADAIIFVLRCDSLLGRNEVDFAEDILLANGFDDPFILMNYGDKLTTEEDRRDALVRVDAGLSHFPNKLSVDIVSAAENLSGKLNNDAAAVQRSGMAEFESKLQDFLVNRRGKAKLALPAKELSVILQKKVTDTVKQKRSMYAVEAQELQKRYQEAQPRLDMARERRRQLKDKLDLGISRITLKVKDMAEASFNDIYRSIPQWLSEYKFHTAFPKLPWKMNDFAKEASAEAMDYLRQRIASFRTEWKNTTFDPALQAAARELFADTEQDVKAFFEEIDAVNVTMTGQGSMDTAAGWERAAATCIGGLFGGLDCALIGSFEGFSKRLAVQMGVTFAAVALTSLSILNPFVGLGLIVASFVRNLFKNSNEAYDKIRDSVSDSVKQSIMQNKQADVDKLTESVEERFSEISENVMTALDGELAATERQIQTSLAEVERGRAHLAESQQALDNYLQAAQKLTVRLNELIFKLLRGRNAR